MTNSPIDEMRVRLARRQGDRAARVLDAVFDDHMFAVHGDPDRSAAVARECRQIGRGSGNFAHDLTTIACNVLSGYEWPHDRAGVHATVRRHLETTPMKPPS